MAATANKVWQSVPAFRYAERRVMSSVSFKHTPFGDLAIVSMRGCEQMAANVDFYLKQWK